MSKHFIIALFYFEIVDTYKDTEVQADFPIYNIMSQFIIVGHNY